MVQIDKMKEDGTYSNLSKREKLQVERQRAKLEKTLGSIQDMNRLPSALFVVDIIKEHIAVREATRLGIPVFAIVDTNADPKLVDYVIPANDDSRETVELIMGAMCSAISEGLTEYKSQNVEEEVKDEAAVEGARSGRRTRAGARRERSKETSKEAPEATSPETEAPSVEAEAPAAE